MGTSLPARAIGYLCDVISRIVGGHPQSQLDELLPWAYPTIPGLRAVITSVKVV